ncbi:hypothetical protein BE221DRAFT_77243, partial [Ostreococcus tauri]
CDWRAPRPSETPRSSVREGRRSCIERLISTAIRLESGGSASGTRSERPGRSH